MRILFSPVGMKDPISTEDNTLGLMLYAMLKFKPDYLILYMSA